MPAYKDPKLGTWYVKFRYKDWTGTAKYKTKRGFMTKNDAIKWENEFKDTQDGKLEMPLEKFVKIYKEECFPSLKKSTQVTKENIINTYIIPFLGEKKTNEITPMDIIKWQNELQTIINPNTGTTYAKSYIKTVSNQINAIFNFACKFYKLNTNPASIAGTMGGEDEIVMNFWTLEEYLKFSKEMMKKPAVYYAFQILYWLGCREGEMFALRISDFDFDTKEVSITKTYQVISGEAQITTPKTPKSNRKVDIPDFLCEELKEYLEKLPDWKKNERIFSNISKSSLHRYIKDGAKKAKVKEIKVQDLRHSHVALLIDMGYGAVAIANRMGNKSIYITSHYAHMFPSVQTDIADKLNQLMIQNHE